MSGFAAPIRGEFEAEIALPFLVRYRIDAQGEVDIVAIAPNTPCLPQTLRLDFTHLTRHEKRCLVAGAIADSWKDE